MCHSQPTGTAYDDTQQTAAVLHVPGKYVVKRFNLWALPGACAFPKVSQQAKVTCSRFPLLQASCVDRCSLVQTNMNTQGTHRRANKCTSELSLGPHMDDALNRGIRAYRGHAHSQSNQRPRRVTDCCTWYECCCLWWWWKMANYLT